MIHSKQVSMNMAGGGHHDDHITVALSDEGVEIKDHLKYTSSRFSPPPDGCIHIDTGKGNDIIHIEVNGLLKRAFTVYIDASGGDKLIVGTRHPKVQLQVTHADEKDIVLPDDRESTYEHFAQRIRQWNECNRKGDGLFKKLKRRFIYFFGRDLRFKRPFIVEKLIRTWVAPALSFSNHTDPDKVHYYSSRTHLEELEALACPGDILLRYQDGYPFDRYFVGTWQHAGIYYKKGLVIDAMGNGTYLRTLEQFGEADGLVLMRIRDISRKQVHRALAYAFEQIGKSYSVDFNDNIAEQYCSGLIVNAYKFAGVLPTGFFSNKAIHPDDLLQLPNLKIIWTNRNDLLRQSMKRRREEISRFQEIL